MGIVSVGQQKRKREIIFIPHCLQVTETSVFCFVFPNDLFNLVVIYVSYLVQSYLLISLPRHAMNYGLETHGLPFCAGTLVANTIVYRSAQPRSCRLVSVLGWHSVYRPT